jgi:hypothetical protein
MKKRREVALLNSIEAAGAQVIYDNTAKEWSIVTLSTNKENLLGPFRYGSGVRVEYFDPVMEVRQLIIIGASLTKETIVASTRYRIEVGNPESSYESNRQGSGIFAYTSSSTLSGTQATDRAVVYRALRDKINAYAGANCTAYTLTYVAFTLGTSTDNLDTNFVVGETVTQETSTLTAKVAKCTITGGTFAGDNAAGDLWLYNLSTETGWLETLKTLSAAGHVAATITTPATSNCVVSQTNATTVQACGLAIRDSAGYFTSNIQRGGKNYVGLTQGFATDTPVIAMITAYAMGFADDMIAQAPVWDTDKQDVIRGKLEYNFNQGNAPVSGYTYTKCVIVTKDGDEDSLGATRQKSERESILYVYYSDADLADFKTALNAALLM